MCLFNCLVNFWDWKLNLESNLLNPSGPLKRCKVECKFEWRKTTFGKMIGFYIKQGLCLDFENPADVKCIAVFIFKLLFFWEKATYLRLQSKGSPHLISHNSQYLRWRLSTNEFSKKSSCIPAMRLSVNEKLAHLLYLMYHGNFEASPLNTTLLGFVIQWPLLHLVDGSVSDSCCWPRKWYVLRAER